MEVLPVEHVVGSCRMVPLRTQETKESMEARLPYPTREPQAETIIVLSSAFNVKPLVTLTASRVEVFIGQYCSNALDIKSTLPKGVNQEFGVNVYQNKSQRVNND